MHALRPAAGVGSHVARRIAALSVAQSGVFYLAAITFAELITALISPMWGVLAHVAIMGNLLVHASLCRRPWERAFYLSLVTAPLIRIVSLGMPLGRFPQAWWYVLSSVPLFAVSFALVRNIPLTRRQIAWQLPRPRQWPVTFLIAASGLLLGYAEYRILAPEPLTPSLAPADIAMPALILLVGTGVVEELIFRGILQYTADEVYGSWRGIVFVSVVFAVLHIGHLSVLDVVFVFFVALYFGAAVRWTRSLIGVSIAHGLTNIMLFIVLPLVMAGA